VSGPGGHVMKTMIHSPPSFWLPKSSCDLPAVLDASSNKHPTNKQTFSDKLNMHALHTMRHMILICLEPSPPAGPKCPAILQQQELLIVLRISTTLSVGTGSRRLTTSDKAEAPLVPSGALPAPALLLQGGSSSIRRPHSSCQG
jgi:hypothetical protein